MFKFLGIFHILSCLLNDICFFFSFWKSCFPEAYGANIKKNCSWRGILAMICVRESYINQPLVFSFHFLFFVISKPFITDYAIWVLLIAEGRHWTSIVIFLDSLTESCIWCTCHLIKGVSAQLYFVCVMFLLLLLLTLVFVLC